MTRTRVTAILFVLFVAVFSWGETVVEAPRPGEALYLVVLGDGATEPDVAAMGGRVLRWWAGRRVVAVSPDVAEALRSHAGVAYMQRIWTGEALENAVPALRSDGVVTPSAAPPAWTTGPYVYDSSGNIKSMGSDSFAYDAVGRVVRSTVQGQTESYTFDPYGNLRQLGSIVLTVNETTNRLADATDRITAFDYDGVGNMTGDGRGRTYHYDALGMVTAIDVAGTDTIVHDLRMVYTADDERIVVSEGPTTRFRVRDYGARVLREWRSTGEVLEWERDYLYAGGDLVAGEVQIDQRQNGMRHYHKDHLGSTRMVTDGAGELVSRQDYRPFGAEFPPTTTEYANTGKGPRDPRKFTGHERDYFDVANVEGEYVDYMHARYYSPGWGRFLSVDPTWESAHAGAPQSWNRYAYVQNNPIRFTDPDGRDLDGVKEFPGTFPRNPRITYFDRIFGRALVKFGLTAGAASAAPTRVILGAAGMGIVGRAMKQTSDGGTPTRAEVIGGVLDGASQGIIVRGAKNLIGMVVPLAKDKPTMDDGVSLIGGALNDNTFTILAKMTAGELDPAEMNAQEEAREREEEAKKQREEEERKKQQEHEQRKREQQ